MTLALIDETHIISHVIIFAGYLIAVVRVTPSFAALIRIRLITLLSGAGFFLFCGMTHLAYATDAQDYWLFVLTNHLQAVAILTFLVFLTLDLNRALRCLARAFAAIRLRFGAEAGDVIELTIKNALRGDSE